MKAQVLWETGMRPETREVASAESLEELLDELTLRAQEINMPFSVQIELEDDSAILISVGSGISHLEFYSASHHPPVVASLSQVSTDGDEIVTVLHGGIPSTVSRGSCVPIAEARAAVRQYFETGRRPTNISWSDP
jgi:hypothetical protein